MNELTALTNPLWPAANRRPRATINPASSRNKRAEKIRKASRGFMTIHRTITATVRISPITTWIVVIGEILTVAVMVLWIVMKPRLAFRIFSALLFLELAGLIVALGLLFA